MERADREREMRGEKERKRSNAEIGRESERADRERVERRE